MMVLASAAASAGVVEGNTYSSLSKESLAKESVKVNIKTGERGLNTDSNLEASLDNSIKAKEITKFASLDHHKTEGKTKSKDQVNPKLASATKQTKTNTLDNKADKKNQNIIVGTNLSV
jgi:hypothetical protein